MARFSLLDLLFPTRCAHCERFTTSGILICPECLAGLTLASTLFCSDCGARLPEGKKICHPKTLFVLGAASSYAVPAVRSLIHTLKFGCVRGAAEPLAELLARYVARLALPLSSYVIVPIPLGRARERTRGFNQSHEIANRFASHFGLTLHPEFLVRTRDTKPQSDLRDVLARRANVLGCFSVPFPDRVRGNRILLIDDVSTTGTTLFEAARVLKEAGARQVVGLAVARA